VSRGLIDRLTNRDIVIEYGNIIDKHKNTINKQKTNINVLKKEKDELIKDQVVAIEKHVDITKEQKIHIDFLIKQTKEKNELVVVQAEAIDEFKEQVTKLSEEISGLWDSMNTKMRIKREEEDESENDQSG